MSVPSLFTRIKAALLHSVPSTSYGGLLGTMGLIREPFSGAWQRNIACETRENILAFSAVYACIALRTNDIAKLRIKLMQQTGTIWTETTSAAFSPVLRKPNRYQTSIQFLSAWLTSKLLYGNTYVLKERDNRNVVVAMYVLDPRRVKVLVAEDGGVYYEIAQDYINSQLTSTTVPASAMIHDRALCLFHPLVGVSPIYACAASATQGIRIQANSEKFFANMSRPGGQLTAPGTITDVTAERLKREFEERYSGANLGRLLVTGDGLKYEALSIPAEDAQLIEQLRWTAEDVARCFNVPAYKLGLGQASSANIAAMNQDYYNQTLQIDIESIEALLDEALGLATPIAGTQYGVELDLKGLLRMDPLGQAQQLDILTRGFLMAPNEGRQELNLGPVEGGEFPYAQQQNFSLQALARRDAKADPFASASSSQPAAPPPPADAQAAAKSALAIIERARTMAAPYRRDPKQQRVA